MKIKFLIALMLLSLLTGCAKTVAHMQVLNAQQSKSITETKLNNNQAAIIFIRPSNFARAISSPVAEYKNGDAVAVTNLKGSCKYMHITTPGKHEYVVAGENSHVLKADLKAGKFYYAYIYGDMGVWRERFTILALDPVKKQQELQDLIKNDNVTWLGKTSDFDDWFNNNKESFITKYNNAIDSGAIAIMTDNMGTDTLLK